MNRFILVALVGSIVVVAAGLLFLLSWDIPAPSERVEREISNDSFPN